MSLFGGGNHSLFRYILKVTRQICKPYSATTENTPASARRSNSVSLFVFYIQPYKDKTGMLLQEWFNLSTVIYICIKQKLASIRHLLISQKKWTASLIGMDLLIEHAIPVIYAWLHGLRACPSITPIYDAGTNQKFKYVYITRRASALWVIERTKLGLRFVCQWQYMSLRKQGQDSSHCAEL